MNELFSIQSVVILFTLIVLELVLSVDNIIFLAIVSQGAPADKRSFTRKAGLGLALLGRIVMVLGISWLLRLDMQVFAIFGHAFNAKQLILLAGGLFLTFKSVTEIYKATELRETDEDEANEKPAGSGALVGVILQIMIIDMVFAMDSVLTAVGLTKEYILIIIAMTVAIVGMMFFAEVLSEFIERHPSLKMLALAFLVLVGVLLIADGFGDEINRNYVYFAILFSLAVEALNFRRQANLQREKDTQGPAGI
ncbi:MAG: TerC family protein [Coriobacteriia bacterium]|nr:TerC family protein [Coriobacteriia bacterium]